VVHQLNNLNGLEIKLKNGDWIGIHASPSSFVVMAGDAFKGGPRFDPPQLRLGGGWNHLMPELTPEPD
ncbi:gibberellin 20 oxidase 1-like protein, partial [Trifolium pratense]